MGAAPDLNSPDQRRPATVRVTAKDETIKGVESRLRVKMLRPTGANLRTNYAVAMLTPSIIESRRWQHVEQIKRCTLYAVRVRAMEETPP